jgi:hypothetical protein
MDGELLGPRMLEQMDDIVFRKWTRGGDGAQPQIAMAALDGGSGEHLPILQTIARAPHRLHSYRVFKGENETSKIKAPIIINAPLPGENKNVLYRIGTRRAKDLANRMIRNDTPGPFHMHFPKTIQMALDNGDGRFKYFDGVFAERRVIDAGVEKWVKKAKMNSGEPWDGIVGNVAVHELATLTYIEMGRDLGDLRIQPPRPAYEGPDQSVMANILARRMLSGFDGTTSRSLIPVRGTVTRVGRLVDAMGKLGGGAANLPKGEYSLEYLQNLQNGTDEYRDSIEKARRTGALVTKEDLAISQDYKDATIGLRQSFRGLQMDIFRAFGPPFANLMRAAAQWITQNRQLIVGYLMKSLRNLVSLIHDAIVIFGNKQPLQAIRNNWLYTLKDILGAVWNVAKVLGHLAVIAYKAADALVMRATGKSILDNLRDLKAEDIISVIDKIVVWLKYGATIIGDFINVLTFNDQNIETDIGFAMQRWRDAIIAWVVKAWTDIQPVLAAIGQAFMDLFAGFSSGAIDVAANEFYNLGAVIRIAIDYIVAFSAAFYQVFILQQDAVGAFAWMNTVRDWIVTLYEHLKIAISWFSTLFNAVADFLAQWGIDLRSTLLFLGLMRLVGLGGLLNLVFKGIGKVAGAVVKWLWPAFGNKAGVKALEGNLTRSRGLLWMFGDFIKELGAALASDLGAVFGGVTPNAIKAMGGLGPAIGRFLLGASVLGVAVAAGAWVGAQIGAALADAVHPVAKQLPEIWPKDKYGRDVIPAGVTPRDRPGAAIMAGNRYGGMEYTSLMNASSPAHQQHLGDININVGGHSYPAKMQPDVYEDIKARRARDPSVFVF